MSEYVVVLCTAPLCGSEKIARAVVEEGLAACVNISPVRSVFRWEGKVSDEREEMMLIKTERRLLDRLQARIKELHSYQVPEIIAIPILEGEGRYLQWISDSVG